MNHLRYLYKLPVIVVTSFLSSVCLAQSANPGVEVTKMDFKSKQVIPPSPDAAELGKYGNVPVSLFTGTPTISIPMFELKGNSLSMPVSLSYNAAGFKPDEIAPWTGLGWSLNAGGVITRAVQGNPDLPANYYNASPFTLPTSSDPISMEDYYAALRDGTKETQPDMYYFNFMGHSGKFFIGTNGFVYSKERNMLTISNCSTCSPSSFTITDESGSIFQFSELENTRMIPSDEAGNTAYNTYNFVSAWYLSSVTSADGVEKLQFEYYAPVAEQSLLQNALANQSETNTITYTTYSYINDANLVTTPVPTTYVTRKFLKKVSLTRNNQLIAYVDVESALNQRQDLWLSNFDGERQLKKLKLYSYFNSTATLTKEFELIHGYFSAPDNTHGEKRLRLDQVKENTVASGTPAKPPYQFFYNTGDLPARYSPSIDHWGFHNGAGNLILGIPNIIPTVASAGYSIPNDNYGRGANREANAEYAQITVLYKIVYPTGGYTSFEYEGHDAYAANGIYTTVGGLRIKKITDYSCETGKATEKEYSYLKENDTPSGRIGDLPRYDNYSRYDGHECDVNSPNLTTYTMTISANSIFPLGSFQGSHIGYTRVVETQKDVSTGKSLGKTAYSYNVGYFLKYDEDIASGDLTDIKIYDNGDKLLKHVHNEYQYSIVGTVNLRNLWPSLNQSAKTSLCKQKITNAYIYYDPACYTYVCTQGRTVPTRYTFYDYSMNLQEKKLVQVEEKTYDQLSGSYLANTTNYIFGNSNHTYPTKIQQTTNTAGDMIVTEKKYAADFVPTGSLDDPSSAIALLQSKNILGAEIESVQYRQDVNGNNKKYISGTLTTYLPLKPYPEKIYRLEMASPLSSFQFSRISSGSFSKDSHYKLSGSFSYNNSGNLVEQSKADDIVTSYVWGYDFSYPVAQITGANRSSSLGSINESTIQSITGSTLLNQLQNIRHNVPGALVTLFTYQPLVGMTTQQDQRGRNTYYEYDALARLINVKDHDQNIVRNISYNYATGACVAASTQTLFYNAQASQNFTKGGTCPTGSFPTTLTYTVPYGRYAATTQSAADAMAQADIADNGQAYANTNGKCLFYNVVKSQWVAKDNCTYSEGPANLIKYIVPAGTYSSEISQAAADNLALADIAANGQAWANANGTCSCADEGKKFINGVCETGTRIEYASESLGNGQWKCTYVYTFSDGSYSGYYYTYQSFSCPVGN